MKTTTATMQVPVTAKKQKNYSTYFLKLSIAVLFFISFTSSTVKAQCVAPTMSFHSPVLISGTDNQIGAVYLFPEVIPGVDANIEIVAFVGGAALWNIDDSAGIGYYDAFQPYVVAPANTTSWMDWRITFKVAGTSNDTALACFSITGVDVDGNGVDLQEFIEAATPGSYALDPNTILTFSFDGIQSKATSLVYNIPNIDTAHLEAMFQMNFTNISTLLYRNGAISTYGGEMVRQTCIYFKPFFTDYTLILPVKLLSFNAQSKNESTYLNWSASTENDLLYYTVQKSINGTDWKDLNKVTPGSLNVNNYFITDNEKNNGIVYYRLKETQKNGTVVYSKILKTNTSSSFNNSITHNTLVTNSVNFQISAINSDTYSFEVYAMNGSRMKRQQQKVLAGYNTASVELPSSVTAGMYIVTVKNSSGQIVHQSKMIRN